MYNANAVLFLPLNLVTARNNNECNKNISKGFAVVVWFFFCFFLIIFKQSCISLHTIIWHLVFVSGWHVNTRSQKVLFKLRNGVDLLSLR